MTVVTSSEMREIDRRTSEEFGVASLTLMENAGTAVAAFCLREYPQAKTVGVICGKGNNGGDGFVVARKLHEAGKDVQVLLLADPADVKADAAEMLKRLPVKPVVATSVAQCEQLAPAVYKRDLLIDAVLGTGFKPPANELYAWAIEYFWEVEAPVVSVDLPSGVVADETIEDHPGRGALSSARSSAVVTFTAPKLAHVFQDLTQGPIIVAPIGTPEEAIRSQLGLEAITGREVLFLTAGRPADSNKGNFGHVLVVGGSRGKAGAAAMAGISALRSGAGLCTVATPAGVQSLVSSFAPELMTEGVAETEDGTISLRAFEYGRMAEIAKGKTVLAIGPGISRNDESAQFVRTLRRESKLPVVLDADGLNAFEGRAVELDRVAGPDRNRPLLVVTPHPGEMARLMSMSVAQVQADRIGVVRRFAKERQCIVVLKGHRTLVAEPGGKVWVNLTGNPGMATGGTGDVLTGMIAGFLAQFPKNTLHALLAAVYVHGLAGDLACGEHGEMAMIAGDVIGKIGDAINSVEWDQRLTVLRRPLPQPFWRHNQG
jgi:hydroxyethylthiazole kinase-like uncharacterized protein yjeF